MAFNYSIFVLCDESDNKNYKFKCLIFFYFHKNELLSVGSNIDFKKREKTGQNNIVKKKRKK